MPEWLAAGLYIALVVCVVFLGDIVSSLRRIAAALENATILTRQTPISIEWKGPLRMRVDREEDVPHA